MKNFLSLSQMASLVYERENCSGERRAAKPQAAGNEGVSEWKKKRDCGGIFNLTILPPLTLI